MSISVRDDDVPILEAIRDVTGCGSIHCRPRRRTGRAFDTKPAGHWQTRNRADCIRLVAVLDVYPLRAKKARDYQIWREAVSVWARAHQGAAARGGVNCAVWRRLAELKTVLSEVRSYQGSVLVPKPGEMHAIPARDDVVLF